MRGLFTIAHLTWLEARRRRIVLAAIVGGLLYLLIYGLAVYFIFRQMSQGNALGIRGRAQLQFLTLAGLYVVNFLTIALAILLPVDTLSGEIGSGVMQTLAAKPIRRAEIFLGKWLTYWLMAAAYLVLLAGGLTLVMRTLTGFEQTNLVRALPLMLLGATVVLSISLTGGARLSTITNGLVAFAFYGVSFIGGWIEQIGALLGNETSQRVGTAISLLSPAEAMWRRASFELVPPILRNVPSLGPLATASVPSAAMIAWTAGFIVVVIALGLRLFGRRAL